MKIIDLQNHELSEADRMVVVDFLKRHNFIVNWDKNLTMLYVSDKCAKFFWDWETCRHIPCSIYIPTYSCFRFHGHTFEECLEHIKLGNSPIKSENIFSENFESGKEIEIYCDQTNEVMYTTTIDYKDYGNKC